MLDSNIYCIVQLLPVTSMTVLQMPDSLDRQAERLHKHFTELARRVQFRDRDQVSSFGISVSQCQAIEMLDIDGPLTMGEMSAYLFLELSTVTRMVNGLVDRELVVRKPDANDRRVCRIALTNVGRALRKKIHRTLIGEKKEILKEMTPEGREAAIQAIEGVLNAFIRRKERAQQNGG